MADNDQMAAMESQSIGNSAAAPNYNMMGYQAMYGNGYGGNSMYGNNQFANRQGAVSLAGASGGNNNAGGNSAAASNNGLNQAGNSVDYDYSSPDAATRQINNGIGMSGYGASGAGYGGYNSAGVNNQWNGASGGGYNSRNGGYGGYGGGSGGGYGAVNVLGGGGAVCEDKGLNPTLVLLTLAGAAAAFAVLFRQVTLGRKKRKRNFNDDSVFDDSVGIMDWIEDLAWNGLEEFEEKIDRIADGKDTEDDSWISRIYNEFVGQYGDVDNELKDSDMDGLEPPLLDEKWGLSAAINDNTAKTTVDDSVPLNDDENDASRKKRDVHNNEVDEEVDEEPILSKGEEKCRVEMWRCMSKVVESSLHYMDNADGLMGFAKKTMFKMAFHGGLKNLWGGVMSIPEARSVQRCLTAHEECVSYEVLNREVTDSLDPQDPELEQVQDKMRNLNKKRRIIVNPEFAQSMDQSDGSEQYDEVIEEEDY